MLLRPHAFVQLGAAASFIYAGGFTFLPDLVFKLHFDAPMTPMLRWLGRGNSAGILFANLACLYMEDQVLAAKLLTGFFFMTGFLHPWNARFGYIDPGLPCTKLHHFSEVLLLGLTVAGALSIM